MQIKYKISIVIPSFNVEDYIANAIGSLLVQTIGFENLEIVIVDDCSTDNTKNLILDYAEKYDNIKPIFLESNSGSAGEPRNIGIKHASSDYVMFMDPDDEYCNDFCEVMYNAITETGVDVVKCNMINIRDGVKYYDSYFGSDIKNKFIKSSDEPLRFVSIVVGIHKADLIKNISFPKTWAEDIYFSVKEHLMMDKMLFLNDYFGYKYYDRADSHAKSNKASKIHGVIQTFNDTKELCINAHRYDVLNIVFNQQMYGVFLRLSKSSSSVRCKIELLKELYDFEKDIPNFSINGLSFKTTNFLLMHKLFYSALLSLKIVSVIHKFDIFSKIFLYFKSI